MAKTIQFDEFEGGGGKKALPCATCEAMLADAVDGLLDAADQGWFDGHVAGCAECSGMMADAQRGAAWLELLKTPRPEPSAELLERILAETSGQASVGRMETAARPEMVPAVQPRLEPAAVPANLLAFRTRVAAPRRWTGRWGGAMFEPRLAMTAAMAFFSLALTMNLTGVRLNQIRLSSLSPANLKRSYYEANASAVRYYDNLRVVRVLESRVEDLRQSNAGDAQLAPQPATQPQAEPKRGAPSEKPKEKKREPGPGVSRGVAPAMARPRFELADERIGLKWKREGVLV